MKKFHVRKIQSLDSLMKEGSYNYFMVAGYIEVNSFYISIQNKTVVNNFNFYIILNHINNYVTSLLLIAGNDGIVLFIKKRRKICLIDLIINIHDIPYINNLFNIHVY